MSAAHPPSDRELSVFSLLLPVFMVLLGSLVWLWGGCLWGAVGLWSAAGCLWVTLLAAPGLRRPLHRAWSLVTWPLSFVVSHGVLLVVFYGVLTPTGLVWRLFRRDPLGRRLDRQVGSYWTVHRGDDSLDSFFRQF